MMVSADHYASAAQGWANGASLVYRPLAIELVARAPHPLRGRRVLDVGAGTGLGSAALTEVGARPVAIDLSLNMLRWRRAIRPPAAVGELTRLPVRTGAIDDVFAAFVLNHLAEPVAGLAELVRVTVPGGAVLASVYSSASNNSLRDLVDEVAVAHGYVAPDWYLALKAHADSRLGSADAVTTAAHRAGLRNVVVDEQAVDVGIHTAEDLVDYRFGQAQFTEWLAGLSPDRRTQVRAAVIERIGPVMAPFTPTVLFLTARVPRG